jgi:hypothetical protein
MSKKIQLKYYADRVWFNPEQMSQDDPVRAQIDQAVALLKKADKCKSKRKAEILHAQALAVISPLELQVNTASDDIFDDSPSPDLVFTEQNSDVSLSTENGSLSISYSIRFEMGINSDVTEETYEEWLGEGGWDWVGLTFAPDGYEMDSGSSMSYSIDDDE